MGEIYRAGVIDREEVLKIVREKGNLDSEIRDMDLAELRQLHQVLFEEAVRAGKEKFGRDFDIAALRRKIDNTLEHMNSNICSNPIGLCNRKNCDHYAPDCVARKIRDQINRLISNILEPTSIGPWVQSKAIW